MQKNSIHMSTTGARTFWKELHKQGFYTGFIRLALCWIGSAWLFFFHPYWWNVATIGFVSLLAVAIIVATVYFYFQGVTIRRMERQLAEMRAGTRPVKLERCERCDDNHKTRDGKRRDPHYGGPCIMCDGTGYIDPSKFEAIK